MCFRCSDPSPWRLFTAWKLIFLSPWLPWWTTPPSHFRMHRMQENMTRPKWLLTRCPTSRIPGEKSATPSLARPTAPPSTRWEDKSTCCAWEIIAHAFSEWSRVIYLLDRCKDAIFLQSGTNWKPKRVRMFDDTKFNRIKRRWCSWSVLATSLWMYKVQKLNPSRPKKRFCECVAVRSTSRCILDWDCVL